MPVRMTPQQRSQAEQGLQAAEKGIAAIRSQWTKLQAAGMTAEAGMLNQTTELLGKVIISVAAKIGK